MGWLNKKKEVAKFYLKFSEVVCGIQSDDKNISEDLLIKAFVLYLRRFFEICEKLHLQPIKSVLIQVVKKEISIEELNERIYDALSSILDEKQKEAIYNYFTLGIPPLHTDKFFPEDIIAKYQFSIFESNGELYGKIKMPYKLNAILLPLSVGHFYTYITSEIKLIDELKHQILEVIEPNTNKQRTNNKKAKDLKLISKHHPNNLDESSKEPELPTSMELAISVACIQNIYIILETLNRKYGYLFLNNRKEYKKLGRNYTSFPFIHEKTGEIGEMYFDTTWLHHGRIIKHFISNEKNLPKFDKIYTFKEFIPHGKEIIEFALKSGVNLQNAKIQFHEVPTNTVRNLIATYDKHHNTFHVFPILEYFTKGAPILHSYLFYRLFIEHQIQHAIDEYDPNISEVDTFSGNSIIKNSKETFDDIFPLEYTPSNLFIYYLLINHSVDAFNHIEEQKAYKASLQKGFGEGIFTLKEIIQTLKDYCSVIPINVYSRLIILSKEASVE